MRRWSKLSEKWGIEIIALNPIFRIQGASLTRKFCHRARLAGFADRGVPSGGLLIWQQLKSYKKPDVDSAGRFAGIKLPSAANVKDRGETL